MHCGSSLNILEAVLSRRRLGYLRKLFKKVGNFTKGVIKQIFMLFHLETHTFYKFKTVLF